MNTKKFLAAMAVTSCLVAGCSSGDDAAEQVGTDDAGAASTTTAAAGATAATGELYTPVSDVSSHAAIGQDIGAIKALLDVAKEDEPVAWDAVDTLFNDGESSVKGDGSTRSMATLVTSDEAAVVTASVQDAIDGTGNAAGLPDGARAQLVDKGMSALLGLKITDELAAAETKLAAGETDPDKGAPHNVDEAWAFFTADGRGLASTAEKRAADFEKEGEVLEPVLEALTAAQTAALEGDEQAFATASTDVQRAVNYIFYLATYRYLDRTDPVGQAEGQAFYWGIQHIVAADAPGADAIIVTAFETGDAAAGRAALNGPDVLEALGLRADQAIS